MYNLVFAPLTCLCTVTNRLRRSSYGIGTARNAVRPVNLHTPASNVSLTIVVKPKATNKTCSRRAVDMVTRTANNHGYISDWYLFRNFYRGCEAHSDKYLTRTELFCTGSRAMGREMATHRDLTPRLERVELYLHSPNCLHGVYSEVNLTFAAKK